MADDAKISCPNPELHCKGVGNNAPGGCLYERGCPCSCHEPAPQSPAVPFTASEIKETIRGYVETNKTPAVPEREKYPWAWETMMLINKLTPEITGKAFDVDWFLLRQRFEAMEAELAACREKLAQWETWGIIEVAIRNPNVASYVKEWESRALNAEQQLAAAKDAVWNEAIETACQIVDEHDGYLSRIEALRREESR